ncbi:MAG: transporter associated domain-containing protein [Halopseudomonas sp.]
MVLSPETRPFVDSVFSQALEAARNDLPGTALRLKGSTTVEDIRSSYGIMLDADDPLSLEDLVRQSIDAEVQVGASIVLNGVILTVREMIDARIVTVELIPQLK